MIRRDSLVRVAVVLTFAVGWLLAMSSEASTQASVQFGWWTTAPVAVAPDATGDRLVVQGGADANQPVAFTALGYTLSGGSAKALKLTVASGSATTPATTLAVCPLKSSTFEPAHGGAAADAPEYDCATKATAAASDDGKTYTFEVASLAQEGTLAVAVVPTTPTDRVVFEPPDDTSLEMSSSSSSDAGFSDTSEFSSDSSTDSAFGGGEAALDLPASSSGDLSASTDTGSSGDTGATGAAPAAGAPAAGGNEQALQAAPASSKGGGGTSVRGPLFIALALAAAGLWYVAGTGDRQLDTGDAADAPS